MKKIAILLVENTGSISEISKLEPEVNPLPYLEKYNCAVFKLSKKDAKQQLAYLSNKYDVFLNLCDGAEGDDRPGVEVVQFLEEQKKCFTGASSSFYEPSRQEMKNAAILCHINTPKSLFISNLSQLESFKLSFPCIVKHPNSYSSIGLTKKSVVSNFSSLKEEVIEKLEKYQGALIEEYIKGDEYTALVASKTNSETEVFYPAKIVFPTNEEFKHFSLKWEQHSQMQYIPCPDPMLAKQLMKCSNDIYQAMNGSGYARFDYRVDNEGNIYFIELNPNCSLFYPPDNASSADEILSFHEGDKQIFVNIILGYAMQRFK